MENAVLRLGFANKVFDKSMDVGPGGVHWDRGHLQPPFK